MNFAFNSLDKFRDLGLLILRVGIGATFILVHGGPKLLAGPERWEQLGGAMELVGIGFLPVFWGFMAAFAESVGALLLVMGFLARPALVLLTITMAFAVGAHLILWEDDWSTTSHALKMGIVFFSLIFIGPGRFSIDQMSKK